MSIIKILNVKEMLEELYFKNLLCVRQNSNSLVCIYTCNPYTTLQGSYDHDSHFINNGQLW